MRKGFYKVCCRLNSSSDGESESEDLAGGDLAVHLTVCVPQ